MADLKERNVVLVSKDSEGVTTLDYPLTIPDQIEGLEEFVKKYGGKIATTLAGYGITDAKIENGVITLGNNSITPITSLANVAKTNQDNNFSAVQTVPSLHTPREEMPYQWNTTTPTNHVARMSVSGNTTINLSNIFSNLPMGNYIAVYTCFIYSSGSYSLSITGADAIYYIGSASDCALKSPAVLLNVLCWRGGSGGSEKGACVSVSACG